MLLPLLKLVLLGLVSVGAFAATDEGTLDFRLGRAKALNHHVQDISCTLAASGGDDAPAFLSAVQSCATTTIPEGTIISIGSPLNMSGLQDKHIVSSITSLCPLGLIDI